MAGLYMLIALVQSQMEPTEKKEVLRGFTSFDPPHERKKRSYKKQDNKPWKHQEE